MNVHDFCVLLKYFKSQLSTLRLVPGLLSSLFFLLKRCLGSCCCWRRSWCCCYRCYWLSPFGCSECSEWDQQPGGFRRWQSVWWRPRPATERSPAASPRRWRASLWSPERTPPLLICSWPLGEEDRIKLTYEHNSRHNNKKQNRDNNKRRSFNTSVLSSRSLDHRQLYKQQQTKWSDKRFQDS